MKKKIAALLLAALLLAPAAGCGSVPASSGGGLVGTWKDACGLTEYRFEPGGGLRLKALSFGRFRGTYRTEGDRITIRYRVLGREVDDTYTLRLEGNTLYLNDGEFVRRK